MTNSEINYIINELSALQASEGWKIMLNHIESQYNIADRNLKALDSTKNIVKYTEYDMDIHDLIILEWMKTLVPTLINEYMNQKSPEWDFEQV